MKIEIKNTIILWKSSFNCELPKKLPMLMQEVNQILLNPLQAAINWNWSVKPCFCYWL